MTRDSLVDKLKKRAAVFRILALVSSAILLASVVLLVIRIFNGSDELLSVTLVLFVLGLAGLLVSIGQQDKANRLYGIIQSIGMKKNPDRPIDRLLAGYAAGELDAYVRSLPLMRPHCHAEVINGKGSISIEGRQGKSSVEIFFEDTLIKYYYDENEDARTIIKYSEIKAAAGGQADFIKAVFGVLSEELSMNRSL